MEHLRIVHALPFFDPAVQFGGPVTQTLELCRRLAAAGHAVSVVTTDVGIPTNLPRDRWLQRDGFRVWYASTHRLGHIAPYHAPAQRRPLREAMTDADIVHTALSFTHTNVQVHRLSRQLHVPYVYTPRSCLDPIRLKQRRLLKRAFMMLFERAIIRDAAAVHALTEAERSHVLACGAQATRVHVIPNGTPLAEREDWPQPGAFRKAHAIPADCRVVLFLGRLHPIKGLDLLVQAFAHAHKLHPDALLVLAGPDEGGLRLVQREAQRLGVDPQVRWVGPVYGEMKLSAYRDADVFALTSYAEGMSNSILEALACGVPVLATDTCYMPEIQTTGAGRVCACDATALGQALSEMLSTDDLTPMRNAAQRLGRHHHFAHVVDAVVNMYRHAIESRTPTK